MDSKRRMVEIHIWDQPFFSELSQTEKLFYWFMTCKCDNVGVYRHNPKLAAFHCEGEINLDKYIRSVNLDRERLKILTNGSVWRKDFVRDTWGTLAAGNNLGISCYKLLSKHHLLERFISEYPNCINIKSFRDKITDGKLNLPLPHSRSNPASENGISSDFEGQDRPKAATINNTNSINGDIGINVNPKSSLYYYDIVKALKKVISKEVLRAVPNNVLESDIKSMVEIMEPGEVEEPSRFIIEEAENTDWEAYNWKGFKEIMMNSALDDIPF